MQGTTWLMCQVMLSEPRHSPGCTYGRVLGLSIFLGNFRKKDYEKVILKARLAKGRCKGVYVREHNPQLLFSPSFLGSTSCPSLSSCWGLFCTAPPPHARRSRPRAACHQLPPLESTIWDWSLRRTSRRPTLLSCSWRTRCTRTPEASWEMKSSHQGKAEPVDCWGDTWKIVRLSAITPKHWIWIQWLDLTKKYKIMYQK